MENSNLKGAERYTKVRCLGSKIYGSVILAIDKVTNQKVAIRQLERGPKVDEFVGNEIRNHQTLFHAHIVGLVDCFLTEKHLCLVTEYASIGNLMNFINRNKGVEESVARCFFQQLIIAVDYCHKMGIAVGNIRLDTILLNEVSTKPILKLFDFRYSVNENHSIPSELVGESVYTESEVITKKENDAVLAEKTNIWSFVPSDIVHTPTYGAPEVITRKENKTSNAKKTDIWSCGVLLYTMIFSYYPFIRKEDVNTPDSDQKIHKRILNAPLIFPQHRKSSADLRDLLSKMLEKDPNKRITLDQIMKHRWFRVNLPEGALDLNEKIESRQNGLKSEAEIAELIEQAKLIFSA